MKLSFLLQQNIYQSRDIVRALEWSNVDVS